MDILINKFLRLEIDEERDSKIKLSNEELFFKVWRNVYIRNKCIFFHLKNYIISSYNKKHSFESLREYPLRNYLTLLKIRNDETVENDRLMGCQIPNKVIPNSVEILIINQNVIISEGDIPNSIHTLNFGKRYRETLSNYMMPNNLIKLRFGHNTKIKRKAQLSVLDQVPPSLVLLCIKECDRDTIIPKTIKNLSFVEDFHHNLPFIPPNIENLSIGNKFNKEIDFLNLKNLKVLKIGKSKRYSSLYTMSIHLKELIYLKVFMLQKIITIFPHFNY
ncbi:hypothetical protein ACTFIU_008302 [Dictyostelium citrinum]